MPIRTFLSLLLIPFASAQAAVPSGELAGLWCNSSEMELEAGIRETRCAPGTVGLSFSESEGLFRAAGQELLCGGEVDPVFLPFVLKVSDGELYTAGYRVGWIGGGGAGFTLGNPDLTATEFTLRAAAGGLYYDEVTRDLEGWVINRNRGTFRRMPVGTRSCAGSFGK